MSLTERNMAQVGELYFDVNPESEWMEVKFEDKTTKIRKMDLWAFVYAIMGDKEQEALMPVRQTEVMHYEKTHMVKLKRDMKAGDVVKVRCHTSVPTTVIEGLKGMIVDEAKKGATGIKIF